MRLLAPTVEVMAHCDLPCGVCDPAHVAAVPGRRGERTRLVRDLTWCDRGDDETAVRTGRHS